MLLDVINPYVLLGIGLIFIAFEAIITSFILIWFGFGFVLTSFISFAYDYTDGLWQLGTVAFISLLFVLLLRKKALEKFLKSEEEVNDNFLDEEGIGQIKNSKVFYKGTYWEIDSSLNEDEFSEGEKVIVTKTQKNFANIKKTKSKTSS